MKRLALPEIAKDWRRHAKRLDPAALKRQWKNRAVVAVTLHSAECTVRLIRREDERVWPAKSVSIPIGAEAAVSQPDALGRELQAVLAAQGIRERNCVVCIPPGWALTHSTDIPELTGEDLRGYLELRAEKEFPIPISELRLAHSSFALSSGQRRVTLAAVPAKRLAAIERALEVAGCKVVSLSLGLDHLLPRVGDSSKVHFLANGNHVDVVITAGGGIAGVRSLSTAATPRDEDFDAVAFCREVRITLGRLPDGLRQGVCEARFGGVPASADSLCEKTRAFLGRMGIHAPENCAPLGAAREVEDIEAAERFLRDQPSAFEFVTPEVKRWQEWLQKVDSKRKRTISAAAVAFLVLLALAFFIRGRIESSLASEWAGMRGNVAEIDALQGKIRRFRPWFEATPQSLAAFEVLASAFSENGDTWAKNIQVHDSGGKAGASDPATVVCTGFAKSQTALTELIDRVRKKPGVVDLQRQQVRGERPIQFSFTYKWEPKNAN